MHEQEMDKEHTQEQPEEERSEIEELSGNSKETVEGDQRNQQEGRDGDALAWLEGPAFNAPIEEMPTLQWPENHPDNEPIDAQDEVRSANTSTATDSQTDGSQDNLEDAMLWLEQLAAGQGTPINEMPTLISSGQYDDLATDDSNLGPDLVAITGKTSTLAEHDSDPMAWLEQLAVDQNSPLEELPSVADRLLASEIVSQNEGEFGDGASLMESRPTAIEVEEALNYLEELAASQGITLDQVEIDQIELPDPQDNGLNMVDQLAVTASAATVLAEVDSAQTGETLDDDWDELAAQIPDDPDEALAWLGGLSDDEKESEGVQEKLEEGEAGSVAEMGVSETTLDVETLDEMPDDPDEAMAWMRGLAGQQDDVPMESGSQDNDGEMTQGIPAVEQKAHGDDHLKKESLGIARKAVASGDLSRAIELYQEILENGDMSSDLVRELESVVAEQPDSPDLVKLLGDAYMQDGQMQKALETYRKGFDHL